MPIMASPKGSAVPVSTELMTMQNSEAEIATESMRLPSVMYTRANPATARPGKDFHLTPFLAT